MADNIARVCAKAEIAPDSVKSFEVGDKRLAVFNIGGRYYVTDDECTHAFMVSGIGKSLVVFTPGPPNMICPPAFACRSIF